jgi:hypothetical protein
MRFAIAELEIHSSLLNVVLHDEGRGLRRQTRLIESRQCPFGSLLGGNGGINVYIGPASRSSEPAIYI